MKSSQALTIGASLPSGQFSGPKWVDALVRNNVSAGPMRLACILLAHFDYQTGLCKRRMDGLADQLGVSRSTVKRWRAKLEEVGALFSYQTSRHKCNRFLAMMPTSVLRPPDPNVGPAQASMKMDLKAVEEAALKASESADTPSIGSIQAKSTAQYVARNNKNDPRGGSPKEVAPKNSNSKTKSKLDGEEPLAPSGCTPRPLDIQQATAKGVAALNNLREQRVNGVLVGWLAVVCNAHQLDWLANRTMTYADHPTAYVVALVNKLTAGTAAPPRVDPANLRRGAKLEGPSESERIEARNARDEAARAAQLLKPVVLQPLPPLHLDPEGFDVAWAQLDEAVRVDGVAAWKASRESQGSKFCSPGRRKSTRDRLLFNWLVRQGVDLGLVSSVDRIECKVTRDIHNANVAHYTDHKAAHPELYPED